MIVIEDTALCPEIELHQTFKTFSYLISTMIQSKTIHLVVGSGETGLGKSYATAKYLNHIGVPFVSFTSKTTPLALYKFLYEHSKDLIVFDDIMGLFDNDISVSLLRAAIFNSETTDRIVEYHTTSPQIKKMKLPTRFIFDGKIILLTNDTRMKDNHRKALKDRSMWLTFQFSTDEKKDIMKKIAYMKYPEYEDYEKNEIFEYFDKLFFSSFKDLSLRHLNKAFEIYRYSPKEWKTIFSSICEFDEEMQFVYNSIINQINRPDKEFVEKGYGSKKTYFRIKNKILKDIKGQNQDNKKLGTMEGNANDG